MLVLHSVTLSSWILSAWAFSWAAISSVLISVYKRVCLTLIWIGCGSPGEHGPPPSHPACWMEIKCEITSSNTTKYHALRTQILELEELTISFHRNHHTVSLNPCQHHRYGHPTPLPLNQSMTHCCVTDVCHGSKYWSVLKNTVCKHPPILQCG